MSCRSRLCVALWPLGVALGIAAEWAQLQRGVFQEPVSTAVQRLTAGDFAAGVILITCGLVAWVRRPQSRVGPLLALSGFAWFLGTPADSGRAAFADFGGLFVALYRGPLVHALLSYPSGRLSGRFTQAVVAFAYLEAVVVWLGGDTGVTLALAVLVAAAGIARYVLASGPERRARIPAAVAAMSIAAVLAAASVASLVGASEGVDRAFSWALELVVSAVAIGLVADLLFGRWTQSTVTGLVVDLGEFPEEGTLRDRLAAALGDRSLVVGYWMPETGSYVDERGRPVELPDRGSGREVTLVGDGDEPVAALVHDAAVIDDERLVGSVASAARIAVSNVRLQADIRRQLDELEASRRRIVEAGDAERRRLERELHAGAQRRLARVDEVLRDVNADGGAGVMLAETRHELELAQSELTEFARGIHPGVLTEGGLAAALADLAGRAAVDVELRAPSERFSAPVESTAYFVCSEALANVGKYARASRAVVEVVRHAGQVTVEVGDDGVGGASLDRGTGLRGLADRVEAIGGSLTIDSPPGHGTRLSAELPLG